MDTRLKAVRRSRGWSQLRLITELERAGAARGIALSSRASLKTQVSRWENGHVIPDDFYAALLAEVYGSTPDDLGLHGAPPSLVLPRQVIPTGLSVELLDSLERLLLEYTRTDNAIGPGLLVNLVTRHVEELERLVLDARGDLRLRGLVLCSRFAEFAGWLCHDAGDLLEAERWTNRGLDYVEGLGDKNVRAYLLMRKSAIAVDRRQPARALSLADAAGTSGPVVPQVAALVQRQRSIAHALCCDAKESDRAAETAVELVAHDANGSGDLGYCTPAYVLMETGEAAMLLRRHDLAADRLAAALECWPDGFRRDRGIAAARLAVVEATRGNLDAACERGRDALDITAVASSARVLELIQMLDRRLEPHARSNVVAEFRSYSGQPD